MAGHKKKPLRRGRQEGSKNLRKTKNGNLINQHGVEFTANEKRLLVNAVNRANAKRNRMIKSVKDLPRNEGGKPTGDTVGSLLTMGKENDFIIAKKTKSLQRFKSKDDYHRYMRYLSQVHRDDYVDLRVALYKDNYITALRRSLGTESDDIVSHIQSMSLDDYMTTVFQNEDLEIGYVYSEDDVSRKADKIRTALKMNQSE